jgi:cell division protein FtsN
MRNHPGVTKMSVTPKNRLGALRVLGGAIALIVTTFVAVRLTGNSGEAKPQTALENTVGTASAISTPRPKERVRYQAVIENWRRYRASANADE